MLACLALVGGMSGCGDDDPIMPTDGGMNTTDGGMNPDGGMMNPDGGMMNPDGGMPGTDLFPAPTITTCPGDAIPSTGTACNAPSGDGEALLITGDILTPGEVFRGGQVLVGADGMIACVGCNCADNPAASGATELVCPDAVVSPGLINGHDHITFANAQPYAGTEERYEHRNDWRRGIAPHNRVSAGGGQANGNVMRWAELRQIMGGATSVFGSGGTRGLMRNLDGSSTREGLPTDGAEYQTFPLGDSSTSFKRSEDCDYDFRDNAMDVARENAYVPHLSEGIDEAARNEYRCTREGANDLIAENTAIIHGVGLRVDDINELSAEGAQVIWSPRTNIALYGDTARVTEYAQLGVTIGLGTDWLRSGSMNVLRELACADSFNANHLGGFFPDEQLWLMATRNTAIALGFENDIGTLQAGLVADIAIFDATARRDHRAVIAAENDDVVLVLRGGDVLYGDSAIVPGLADGCDAMGDVCGADRHVCLLGVEGNYAALAAANGDTYPLFFCDTEPTNEPSCLPARTSEGGALPDAVVNGSNRYTGMSSMDDMDGDGIPNAMDNCSGVFNPIRPLDNGMQADFDMDGVGDACDTCPLGGDEDPSSCNTVDPNDRDADGVPNMMDNCPSTPNMDQADADMDGKGDVCDACPMAPNPGAQACPALETTVYDIRGGMVTEGTEVTLEGLLVNAVGRNGFWLQQSPDSDDFTSIDFSGIYVYTNSAPSGVAQGDLINVDRATYSTFRGADQLTESMWTVVSSGNALAVETIADPATIETAGARAGALSSVLVRVENVMVTNPDADFGQFAVDGGLLIAPSLYTIMPAPGMGEEFSFLQGPLDFSFENTKIQPRNIADVGFANMRISPTERTVVLDAAVEVTVVIPDAAPVGGAEVTFTVAPMALATGPATLTIPEGMTSGMATFTASSMEAMGTITAAYDGDMATLDLTVVEPTGAGFIISEYGEGTASNKVLELFNGSGAEIAAGTCELQLYRNGGSSVAATYPVMGAIATGSTYVICHADSDAAGLPMSPCDQTAGLSHNGDDAYALVCGGMIVDSIGSTNGDPGDDGWMGGGISTKDHVLRRSCTMAMADTDLSDDFDPSMQWESAGMPNATDGYGSHCE